MTARGFAKRDSRQSERTGGGDAAGIQASHTVLGGSIVAPQEGQIETEGPAWIADFDFFSAEGADR
jgi:hypothetical protein